MRFNEFEKDAIQNVVERRDLTEEQLDEILPALAIGTVARAAGGALARGAAKVAGRALAKGAGRALGRAAVGSAVKGAAGALARGAVKGAGRAAANLARGTAKSIGGRGNDEPETNDPNATVGTQNKVPMGTTGTSGTTGTQTKSSKIKPGQTLKLPSKTATGKPGPKKPFKITKIKGDEVEIQNPMPQPGEPSKFTYNKQDLEGAVEQ